nr:GDYXXLXY domain-containing protein [Solimonas marina]
MQWALPAQLAWRSASVLRDGTRYYLRTAPVDPADAFRGRYIALRFADAQTTLPASGDVEAGTTVYVPLIVGKDRFARFGAASLTPPARGDYLRALIASVDSGGRATLQLPFDRYYLDESVAAAADRAYRAANRSGAPSEAYVTIRVHDGDAVLESLFIDNQPIRRYLDAQAKASG